MSDCYVDTSVLLSIAFAEHESTAVKKRLRGFKRKFSSPFLEAEFRAACVRERVDFSPGWLQPISWVVPMRRLSPEIGRVLESGYLRGADLWHLASAIFLAPDFTELTFFTLDQKQREVASAIGFQI